MKFEIAVLLHNVRSTHNVGSIFRTADASGVEQIFLTGYTPRPIDRFGRVQKDIAKTALGAESTMSWQYHRSPSQLIVHLEKKGWHIVGVEQDVSARNYRSFVPKKKTLFIFGNEVLGLSRGLRNQCELIEIPMRGRKESLNVSVAAGIVLFSALN